jgi:hypothetical protein
MSNTITLVASLVCLAICSAHVAPSSDQRFPLFHSGQSFMEPTFKRVHHFYNVNRTVESAAGASFTVKVLCDSDHLCFAKACDVIDSNRKFKEGIRIGAAQILGARPSSESDLIPCPSQPVTVSVCIRTAEESASLFFLPDDNGTFKDFDCFAAPAATIDGAGYACDILMDIVFLTTDLDFPHLGVYEFFVIIEIPSDAGSSHTTTLVSQPAHFVISRNISVLVWGDHGGTLKTATEMLLMSGVVPERLFCFHHTSPGVYAYALRDTPCTVPQFPAAMGVYLRSMVTLGQTPGVMGHAYSYLNGTSTSDFLQWSSEFDMFDVSIPCLPRVLK